MTADEDLARRFEAKRAYLHGLALKVLGRHADAEDAVQETWLRVSRAGADHIDNLDAWLTTVTGRICLDMLRRRKSRREDPVETRFTLSAPSEDPGPETEVLLAESVGLALYVVLDGLRPPERVAFVLHDLFGVAFDTIAEVLGRTPEATRMLASRARRRVRVAGASGETADREIVDAFFAAARSGRLDDLVALLAPDIVLRTGNLVVRGAREVASGALRFARPDARLHPAVVNGLTGVVVTVAGEPFSIMSFTVHGRRIVAIDSINDRAALATLVPSWVG